MTQPLRPARLLSLLLVPALAGCAAGPDYTAPTIALPAAYVEGGAASAGNVASQTWWRDYRDPLLDRLVGQGLAQNLSIRLAVERVGEAQATLRTAGPAALLSGNLALSSAETGGSTVPTKTRDQLTTSPSLVLDLFGGARRNREAALASLQARKLDVGTARLAFLSSLVTNYVNARYYQSAAALTRATIRSREDTLKIVREQLKAGTATELDVATAEAALAQSRTSLPTFESGYYAAVYAMATLLAEPAGPLLAAMNRGAAQPSPRVNTAPGVPADLLRNRPDIRAAERSYAAAVAAVGVAEAARLPSISLGGTITLSTVTTWSFGPSLLQPLLNQPVLAANADAKISAAREAELSWKSAVLKAVQDVQAAESAYIRAGRSVSTARDAVAAYERAVSLSRDTYRAGATTLIDLLTNERALTSAQLTLASAEQSLANSWATLQVAVGRGWGIGLAVGGGA